MDYERARQNLSKAISIDTVSYDDISKFNLGKFDEFLKFLEDTYPLINKKLEKTMINNYSPVFHWKTSSEKLPILLTAHYDVVPVNEDSWSVPPFSGQVKDAYIWGRGAIDDKNSIISLMETIEALLKSDYQPKRDIYLAFGYDEETMGKYGATQISKYFEKKNIKFECVLDEGGIVTEGSSLGIDGEIAVIGIAEKSQYNFEFTFTGEQGHSSAPPKNTSIGKMAAFIKDVEDNPKTAVLTKPVEEMLKIVAPKKGGINGFFMKNSNSFFSLLSKFMSKGKQTNALIRTTVAFTICSSGSAPNVLPNKAKLIANVRALPGESAEDVIKWFKSFNHEFEVKQISTGKVSKVSNTKTKAYEILKESIEEVFNGVLVSPYLMIGGTDARHYENLSDCVYRFMPCILSSKDLELMHADDERISLETWDRMMDFYKVFINKITS